jgi:hypothetical protein
LTITSAYSVSVIGISPKVWSLLKVSLRSI